MSATIIAVTSANTSIAAANAARARQKYLNDCKFVVEYGGVDKTNTVAEKQVYAECVGATYPPEHNNDPSMKIFVSCILIAALIGSVIGFFKADYGVEEKLMLTIFGAMAGVASVMVGAAILAGIQFVFS